ncbi:MAG: matrixin family metalloprotease [Nitrososphaera sp.]
MKVVVVVVLPLFIASLLFAPLISHAYAALYYKEQSDFSETTVPAANYKWDHSLQWCIYKEPGVPNKYYVWVKLAVQDWKKALREYTGNIQEWNMSARYVSDESGMAGCDVRVFIYDTYRDFPGYPDQKGAYTVVKYSGGIASSASVYMSPKVLHGDGVTELDLRGYAFRNSAVHEAGHVLGLSHMAREKGYLMSPVFDFFEQSDQLPITTLELGALVDIYGTDGFS